MDFLSGWHPALYFIVGIWVGVFWGIIIVGLFRKEDEKIEQGRSKNGL